jgi:sugar transferase EpsL
MFKRRITAQETDMERTHGGIKRLIELSLTVLSSPIWIPLMLFLGIAVSFRMGRPVIFRQERAGIGGKRFHVLKFRTMTDARDELGQLLPDSSRLTSFGQWLRSTSLDELPELVNVLKGDMSLVGPRPLHYRYVHRYSPSQRRRLDILPGLTGWAQVNGRNSLSWEDRFELDLWYLTHQSHLLDLKILFMTLKKVFERDGIAADGVATMGEFYGNERGERTAHAEETIDGS